MKDDIKQRKQLAHKLAELAAEEARRYAESIVETVREPSFGPGCGFLRSPREPQLLQKL